MKNNMDLIYYRGLNCHLASMLNIADILGANYLEAFAALWSETDFCDDKKHNIYTSKRVYTKLDSIGIKSEAIDFTKDGISRIADGEWLLVGADTFGIPWHRVFGHFHSPHYFFAKKESPRTILCFDPVYSEANVTVSAEDILPHVFELRRVYKLDASPKKHSLTREAQEILRGHPEYAEELSAKILSCAGGGKSCLTPLLKQITAMLNNRYMFGRYFHACAPDSENREHFFDEAYFAKWEAVKNGLCKAGIVKENSEVLGEVHGLFSGLMRDEMDMARGILRINNEQ